MAMSPQEQEANTLCKIAAKARANSERWFPLVHNPDQAVVPLYVHYALGLAGEAGEVANLVKKLLRFGHDKGTDATPALADELADVFTYLLLLADECGVDLMSAYEAKKAICEERWG